VIARLGLRMRMWLLLTLLTGVVLLSAGWIVSVQTLDPGAEQLAALVYATASALDERVRVSGIEATRQPQLQSLGIRLQEITPPDHRPRAPVGVAVLARVRRLYGADSEVRFDHGPPSRLWLHSRWRPQLWIGVPVQPLGAPIARASLWILLLTAVLVLAVGAWTARMLSRPLEQLARRAPDLMAGDLDLREFRNAPAEVRTLAATLARSLADARRRHDAREEMLVGLSHDLRTPLARLRFAIEMGDHNEEVARTAMQADIAEMDALIGAFLLMQREGRDEPAAALDLNQLCRDLVAGFAHRIAIRLDLPEQTVWLHGRRLGLRRALSNLLQNALDHGRPPLALRLSVGDEVAEIAVADGGQELRESGDRRGFGVGLAVVRATAALHRGRFELSRGIESTVARLILPLLPATAPAQPD